MSVSDPAYRRPQPARLVFLDQVHSQSPGAKIRVLGCVHDYKASKAMLALRSRFPAAKQTPVYVDVSCVLESLNHEMTAVGAWINIIGNVRHLTLPSERETTPTSRPRVTKRQRHTRQTVVAATMIWSAGAIKVADYEAAAKDFISTNLKDG